MEHWLEREIAQWVHPMKDRSDDPSHHEQTLLPELQHTNNLKVLLLLYIAGLTPQTLATLSMKDDALFHKLN